MSSEIQDTKSRILDAALAALEGGGAARMADIARAAGISRQALYLHYPNRADLLIAATRHLDTLRDVDARLAPSRAASSGVARLDAFVAAWGGYIPEIHGVARALMAMQDSDAAARQAWADRMEAVRQGCAAAVAALARDGDLAPSLDETRATDLLWALLSVGTWQNLTQDCGWPQETYLAQMQRLARLALVRGAG